ncbi:MAG: F0F1 ATP synthase subunit C [Alphaproteobacteria bacterium]|nr:F0F1 ATP synthase subunit C [Alphaproteobacteria bacterium]MCL2505578.1 F0F1 ATP synthase subunit C [Alphaproteobacteria bacterium]
MDAEALKFIGVGLVMLGATIGAGFGLSRVFSSWLEGIARNPSADTKLSKIGFIAFAGTELVLLLGFVVAIMTLNA